MKEIQKTLDALNLNLLDANNNFAKLNNLLGTRVFSPDCKEPERKEVAK